MDTLILWRPTRLMARARAGILFLLLTAAAGSGAIGRRHRAG